MNKCFNSCEVRDGLLQLLLSFSVLVVFGRLVLKDNLFTAVLAAVGILCGFSTGRLIVRFLKNRYGKQSGQYT